MIWDQFPMSRMNSERFWRKWKFWIFQAFLLRFQAYFMHKSFKKWMRFWLFEKNFKNEAFNQKSETVVLLRYIFTCFHDHGGTRKLILSKPRPYSEAHEKLGFEAFSSANKEKVVFEVENSISQKLFWFHSSGQKCILITSQVSHNDLGPISDA